MKTFYEMMALVEQDMVPQGGQQVPEEQGVQEMEDGLGDEGSPGVEEKGGETKHYMFFSNLKSIKEKAEKILEMDAAEVDRMLGDGHDWATDHIATSKDDVEEVYNWLMGEKN